VTATGARVRPGPLRSGRLPLVLPRRPAPAQPRTAGLVPGPRALAVWYALFTVYAGIVAIVSSASYERIWGNWAVGSYAAAGALAFWWRSHGRDAALLVSLAGALVAPLCWLSVRSAPTPDALVVSRSAVLLLRHGTPYLSPAQLAHLPGHLGYNPYLPAMALFGMPKALGITGLAADPRPWLAATTLILLVLAFRIAGQPNALRCSVLGIATPIVAFPLALAITDPPMLALVCLALALLSGAPRTAWAWIAAIAIGVACAMKYTAWPALPVLAALVAVRDGARAAVRFAVAAAGTTLVLVAAFAPAALGTPGTLFQNTVLYPLALTHAQTPAASPLPGHLLATTGHAGHLAAVGLMLAAGLAVAVSLVVRPPADSRAAAWRLAIGLTALFALSPAARFGYFAYPLGLWGWLALTSGASRAGRESMPDSGPPPGEPAGQAATAAPSDDSAGGWLRRITRPQASLWPRRRGSA